jgi:hypothetical protein
VAVLSGGGVAVLLVLAGVWLLTGGLDDVADDWLEVELTSLCGIAELVVSGGLLALDVSGGVVLLDELLELVLLLTSLLGGVVVLAGGVAVLGAVLLLGLFTSLCGIVPVLLQSDEIIFTLLTLIVLELEDDGLVLPAAVPVAFPLAELVPVTWIMCPTCSERLDVSPASE